MILCECSYMKNTKIMCVVLIFFFFYFHYHSHYLQRRKREEHFEMELDHLSHQPSSPRCVFLLTCKESAEPRRGACCGLSLPSLPARHSQIHLILSIPSATCSSPSPRGGLAHLCRIQHSHAFFTVQLS